MNQYELLKKVDILIYSKDEIDLIGNTGGGSVSKSYKPTAKVLNALEEISKKVEENISSFFATTSPFKHIHINAHLTQIIKWHFPFSVKQIEQMDDFTKEEVILKGLNGIKKAIRKYRKWILDDHRMFEDEFETNKLAYVVEYGRESELFTEEDYHYLEKGYMKVLEEAAYHYFGLSINPKFDGLTLSYSDYLTTKFWLHCLKWYDKMKALELIQWRVLQAIEEGTLSELTTDKFDVYAACPISSNWFREHKELNGVSYILKFQLYRYVAAFKNIEKLKELMGRENLFKVVSSTLGLIEFVKKSTENESFSNVFKLDMRANDGRVLVGYAELVKCLPNVKKVLNSL